MQLGIFEKVFQRPSLVEKLDAVRGYGLSAVQFHLSSADARHVHGLTHE